jgi:hypothetical protein
MLMTSASLLCLSMMVLLYACYLDRLMYLTTQLQASRRGYSPIQDAVPSAARDYPSRVAVGNGAGTGGGTISWVTRAA